MAVAGDEGSLYPVEESSSSAVSVQQTDSIKMFAAVGAALVAIHF